MSKKVYKSSRKYKCPYCEKRFPRNNLIDHVNRVHEDVLPENYSAARVIYEDINKTDHGICMICKKPVYTWNEKTSRYNNLCDDPKCREEVRRIALERHIRTYNRPTLLDDAKHQEKMLSKRHISGKYRHSDGAIFTFTGKYEKATIEFMDQVLEIPSKDIQMPGPTLEYKYQDQTHSWITDIYYIPANLIIEVKDGGENPNNRNMPIYRGKQEAKEVMITELGKFNYLRLTNNNFAQLLEALAEIKYDNLDQSTANNVHFFINESADNIFEEEVGGLPPRTATNTWIEPVLMNNTFDGAIIRNTDYNDVILYAPLEEEIKRLSPKEYREKYERPNEVIMYSGDDATEKFIQLLRGKYRGLNEVLGVLCGHKIRVFDELSLYPNWSYYSPKDESIKKEMITTGIIRENQILSGEIKDLTPGKVIKGNVILGSSENGYFIHTPEDYYLSSNLYEDPEIIPSNIIDLMNDLYDQHKKMIGGKEDV